MKVWKVSGLASSLPRGTKGAETGLRARDDGTRERLEEGWSISWVEKAACVFTAPAVTPA